VEATTCTRPKDLEGSISILGEKGTVEIGGFAANQIKVWEFFQRLPEDVEIMTRYNQNPPDVYGWGHAEFLKAVIDSIKNDVSFSIDGPEGRKSLELINAIYESVDTGKEVFLKSMTGNCRLVRH
jgi:predicted dehydrogenase